MNLAWARQKALLEIVKEQARTIRLFEQLIAIIKDEFITPESLDEGATIEAELTGDCVACTIIGKELGLSAYCECDCWEAQECVIGARHLKDCQWT